VVDDLDPSVTVTNAAATDSKTLYMSNGEAGVYVAYTRDKFNSRDCDVDDLELIGQFRLDDLESVNAVKVDEDYLFVAGGLGGLKILEVTEEDD
jgi:peptidase E